MTCVTLRWFDGSLPESFTFAGTLGKLQDCGAVPFYMTKAIPTRKGFNLSRSLLFAGFVLVVSTIGYAISQGGIAAAQAPAKIGPSAVWQPPQDFIANAHAACDKSAPPNYAECFIEQMSKSGAPADAVSFTRMLYRQSDGQVGIMSDFHKVGPVDVARVMYPLRANDNYGLLLVNGDPKVLDVDDLKKLDRAAMDQNAMFQSVKQKYPQADIWPGDRSGSAPWPRVDKLPDGGERFAVNYPLINGCHACQHVGLARFGWDFDAKGKFLRTVYIPTQPPPKLMRPSRPQAQPPSQ